MIGQSPGKTDATIANDHTLPALSQSILTEMKYPLLASSTDSERRPLKGHSQPCETSTVASSSAEVLPLSSLGRPHPSDHSKRGLNTFYILAARLVTLVLAIAALWRFLPIHDFRYEQSPNAGTIDLLEGTALDGGQKKKNDNVLNVVPECTIPPCFTPAKNHVPLDLGPGFPSFLRYAHQGPITVTYDGRSLILNGERAFFLGGSIHPSRATQQTWNLALDQAVQNGLNLITIYVFWSDHQPFPTKVIDWSFPQSVSCNAIDYPNQSCSWNLATAIRSAADRGLFVHIRIGPYDCAEFNYGGIPEWLPLLKPSMQLRRPNREWLDVMESFTAQLIGYFDDHQLWAHQGGPIIMGQIENELGGDDVVGEDLDDNVLLVDQHGNFVDRANSSHATDGGTSLLRNATLQDYADWCGKLAHKYAPHTVWTMCNGLTANNTILTCNAVDNGANWLEEYGGNGRIQVDHPPIFSEFEGGFQDWGETSKHPIDYFWGRTARAMARDALRWFARGGTHLNYYMWWGAYNRGRQAAGGIANWYASDAVLCPSGQRHQPKYSHFTALHSAIAIIAPTLLAAKTALGNSKSVECLGKNGTWDVGTDQRMFEYIVNQGDDEARSHPESTIYHHVIFVENDANEKMVVRIPVGHETSKVVTFTLAPVSAIVVVDGILEFDTAAIDPQAMSFKREFAQDTSKPMLLDWSSWPESIGAGNNEPMTWRETYPIEQTRLNVGSKVNSDYAWYEATFRLEKMVSNATLMMDSQRANGLVVFIDDEYVGATDDHLHGTEGNLTMAVLVGKLSAGEHKLSILSESLGYSNLIGRFGTGGGVGPKVKGITGDVILAVGNDTSNTISLVDGREWRSFAGLHGEKLQWPPLDIRTSITDGGVSPTWYSVLFDSPDYSPTFQGLFLHITSGRGHFWLNGNDLGRYWNITRGDTTEYSQEYYFLPSDYLRTNGALNEIIIFDAFGSDHQRSTELALSWVTPSNDVNFEDEVDFPMACV
jgi:hypothetical protein